MNTDDRDQERLDRERAVFGPTPSGSFPVEGGDMRFVYGEPPDKPDERQRYLDRFFNVTAWELTGVRRCMTCGSPILDIDPPRIPCSRRCREMLDRAIERKDEMDRRTVWTALQHVGTGCGMDGTYWCPRTRHSPLVCRTVRTFYRMKAALCLMFRPFQELYDVPDDGVPVTEWTEGSALRTVFVGLGLFTGWYAGVLDSYGDEDL